MKKTKTALSNISTPAYLSTSLSTSYMDIELDKLQQKSKQNDQQLLTRKNKLLQKQIQQLKQSRRVLQKELDAYRKVVLKNSDIHQILDMQHQKIFQLQTNFDVLQGKYDRLLSSSGSGQQTQYAIKCKELESIIKNKEIQHQKEIGMLRAKMMKMSANQIFQTCRIGNQSFSKASNSINPTTMTPIKNTRKLV